MRIFPALRACILVLGAACGTTESTSDAAADNAGAAQPCPDDAMRVVRQLAGAMRRVSLLAPDSVVRRELTQAYSTTATAALLDEWRANPRQAPGRDVSSPWPARIEISDSTMTGAVCRVSGRIVYVTSADTIKSIDERPATIELTNANGWRVSAFSLSARTADQPADSTPAAIVRGYYAAIQDRRYDDAYAMWARDGSASGKTRSDFAAGFAETDRVQATVGDSVRLEGAAGSQYATVPVTVDAMMKDGTTQRFTGTYTLRRSMVDGATDAQRAWHIESAKLVSSRDSVP